MSVGVVSGVSDEREKRDKHGVSIPEFLVFLWISVYSCEQVLASLSWTLARFQHRSSSNVSCCLDSDWSIKKIPGGSDPGLETQGLSVKTWLIPK